VSYEVVNRVVTAINLTCLSK